MSRVSKGEELITRLLGFIGGKVEHFGSWLRRISELQKSRNPQSSPTEATVVSTADELKKLAELHQQGILTAEEFAEAKSRLLKD